jgi:flagellar biosynthetic protein FliP
MQRSTLRFIGHYVEMVLAMLAGMGILGGLWMVVWPDIHDHAVIHTLVMAADMTIGMAGWMAFRGHARRMIAEMSAAMVAPFVVLLVPLATGSISADTLMIAGHTLMLVTMLAAMLYRRQDHAHGHHHATPVVAA